jgi:hypothetical protein
LSRKLGQSKQVVQLNLKAAKMQLDEMNTKITLAGIKSMIWYFNKTMRRAIKGLNVD